MNQKAEVINKISEYIKQLKFNPDEKRRLSFKEKVWIEIAERNVNICCVIRNLLKKGI